MTNELLAAEPAGDVLAPHGCPKEATDAPEDLVPRRVSERIIEGLEVIGPLGKACCRLTCD